MTLLAPIWLLLLLPWAAACLWAGRGARAATRVPFLTLWPAATARHHPRRMPPLWIVFLLAGALLMIVAAGGPAVWRATPTLTLVIDAYVGLTPGRLQSALDRLALPAATRVRVVPVPGEPYDTVGPPAASSVRPSAVPTEDAVRQRLRDAAGPVVLVTDQFTGVPDGVGVIVPRALVNAGIDRFAISSRPAAASRVAATQAMVRIRNGTDRRRARLRVDDVTTPIDLPPTGQTRNYFIDLSSAGDTAEAALLAETGAAWSDDVAGDDRAFLAATTPAVRLDPQTALSDALARMVAVYQARRAAGAGATGVVIVRDAEPAGPAVLLPVTTAEPTGPASGGAVRVDSDHPVTRNADFHGIDSAARSPVGPPGDGWRVLVRQGDAPLLAVRERPARQAWVGVDTGVLANRADYVLLWTDVFDWLAGGAREWTAEPPGAGGTPLRVADAGLTDSPGLYHDAAGRTVATAMPAVRPGGSTNADGPTPVLRPLAVPLTRWPLAAGMACLAAGLWLGRLTRY